MSTTLFSGMFRWLVLSGFCVSGLLAAPTAVNDAYTMSEDATLSVGGTVLLAANFDQPTAVSFGPWSYLNSLPNTPGTNYPTDGSGRAWTAANFDTATSTVGPWATGAGPFSSTQGTQPINYFVNNAVTTTQVLNGLTNVTTYLFRNTFTLTAEDAARANWTIRYLFDDSAVIWINGQEIRRINLPDAPTVITPVTQANGSGNEDTLTEVLVDLTGKLNAGVNTIAVELHQASTLSDAGMLIELMPSADATGGFAYTSNFFTPTSSDFDTGTVDANTGYNNSGALHVQVGGRTPANAAVMPLSGAYSRTVTAPQAGTYSLSFRYKGTATANYEANDFIEGICRVDSTRLGSVAADGALGGSGISLFRFVGDGNGGTVPDTGWVDASFTVSLSAGTHTVVLGLYNSTSSGSANFPESSDIYFDDLVFGTQGAGVGSGVLVNDTGGVAPVTAVKNTNPAHGSLTFNDDGSFSYTPAANYFGVDTFTYHAVDGTGSSNVATVTITITNVNDPPTAVANSYSFNEDSVLNVAAPGLLGNDIDLDGNTLTAVVRTQPAHGTLTLNANGSFVYTPELNYNGTDSFTYRANDGTVNSADATVSLTINAVNDPPTVVADSYRTLVNTPLNVNLTSATGQPTTTVTLVAPGSPVALGDPGEVDLPSWKYLDNGTDQGTAWRGLGFNDATWSSGKAELGYGDSADGRPERTVVNFGPDANAKYPTTYFRTAFTVVDKASLSSLKMRLLRDDAAVVYLNGTEIYRDQSANGYPDLPSNPAYNAYSSGSISNAGEQTLEDLTGLLATNAAQYLNEGNNILAVEVHQATGNSSDLSFDIELTAERTPYVGVLANDSDPEGSPITAQLVTTVGHGSLTLNANGTFLYTPTASYIGPDSFVYRATDGTATSGNVTVSLTVVSIGNAPPAAADDAYTTAEDTPLNVAAPGVLANDTDFENDTLTAQVLTQPANGTVTLNANGSFLYTPNLNFNGADSFTYRARDTSQANSAAATVSLTVTSVNDPPTTVADNYGTNPGQALVVAAAQGVLANDSDVEGSTLTATLVTGPASGSLNLSSNGGFTYTPAGGFSGTASFTYRASDGSANSAVTTVTIVVNGAPLAGNDSYFTVEDTSLTINAAAGVLANDSDPENAPLTAVLVTAPSHGTLSLNPNGSFTYFPAANYAGTDSFTYQASDGLRTSAPATVTITVTAVDDPPIAQADRYKTTPNQALTVNAASGVLANDSDAEGSPLMAQLISTTSSGVLTFSADGSFTYTPNFNFAGTDSFVYRVSAGGQFSGNATVTIEVTQPGQDIVINEIMYRSGASFPEQTNQEWIELFNRGTTPITLTGWTIGSGVTYAFPSGRVIAPGAYLVVAADVAAFQALHPAVTNVIGGWTGSLSNGGEKVELVDADGKSQDSVTYASEGDWATRVRETTWNGWDWSTLANGGGRSIEVRNPNVSNDNGQNWIVSNTVGGTPGVANDALTTNIPPIIKAVKHSPAVPKTTDTVVISCELNDEFKDDALQATVFWRDATTTSPGAFAPLAMSVDNKGTWFAPIPPKANLTIIEFYISATDGTNTRTWPAPTALGQVANCQYQVTNEVDSTTADTYRMVLTASENSAFNGVSQSSDRKFNHTLVHRRGQETSIRYLCDMRIRGNSSRSYQFKPLRIAIPGDDPLDGSTGYNFNPRASFLQYFGMRMFRAAGLRAPDTVPIELRRNGVESTSSSGGTADFGLWVRMEDWSGEFIDAHWPLADSGQVYKKGRPDQYWRSTAAAPSTPDGLLDGWTKQNNSAANDWSDITTFFQVWQTAAAPYFPGSSPGDVAGSGGGSVSGNGNWNGGVFTAGQLTTLDTVADLDQWARWFAVMTLLEDNETNISNGQDDDYACYFEPRVVGQTLQRRMNLLPHDLDTIFGLGDSRLSYNSVGLYDSTESGSSFRPLLPLLGNSSAPGNAEFRTKYFTALRELIGGVFNADTTTNTYPPFYALVDYHLGNWAPAATRTAIKDFVRQRGAYLLGLIGQGAITPTTGTANATVTSAHGALVIHEVLANNVSAYNNGGVFPDVVELRNTGAVTVSLAGKSLSDDPLDKAKYVFPAGTTLAAGAIMVLHADAEVTTPGVHLGFGLSANGDAVYLYDTVAAGQTLLDSVVFGTQIADFSIGRTGAALDTWALCTPTVGAANSAVATLAPSSAVKINEFLGNADYLATDDFIELYNPGAQPVALGGMRLTDDAINFPAKNVLPPLSFMGAGAFVAFDAKGGSATAGDASELSFNIDSTVGEVALIGANGAIVDRLDTISQFRDVSVGRLPDGSATVSRLSPPSPGFSNAVLAEGVADVLNYLRITEIMYNPASTAQSEYIEFRNMSDTAAIPVTLDLTGVQFTNGITYPFPAVSLPPGGYYVIVENQSKFAAQFPSVPVGGVYSGKLDNGGERVRFELATGSAGILDFSYSDGWYPSTDGGGAALQIVDGHAVPVMWDKKDGWQAAAPTPGAAPTFGVDAGPDDAIGVGAPVFLDGAIYPGSLDPAAISVAWTKDAGPGTVTFTTADFQDANARFSQSGVYTLRFTATGPAGVTASDTVQITVAETYASWAARVLSSQSAANQGPLADPDRDGVSNLAEFTFGSDPLSAGSSSLPTVAIVGDHLVMTWTRSRFADASIEVVPQICGDLAAWLEGAANIPAVMVGQTPTAEQWEAVDPFPVSAQTRRFIRAKITLP